MVTLTARILVAAGCLFAVIAYANDKPALLLAGAGATDRDLHPILLSPFYRDMHVATGTPFRNAHVCHDSDNRFLYYCGCKLPVPLINSNRKVAEPFVIDAPAHAELIGVIRSTGCPRQASDIASMP